MLSYDVLKLHHYWIEKNVARKVAKNCDSFDNFLGNRSAISRERITNPRVIVITQFTIFHMQIDLFY